MTNGITLKEDFPIFRNHPELVYLDSAATSQKPQIVIDALCNFYTQMNANVHRGLYKISEEATELYEAARKKVAKFINAASASEIVFTKNATEAINLVAYSWGRENIKPGDEVLLTLMEHHSNIVPWQLIKGVKEGKGVKVVKEVKVITLTENYQLDIEDFKKKLAPGKIKLVALTHVSNVLGTINDMKAITRIAHEAGARVLIDGAQAVPHMPIDIQDIGCDFYVFSGHKMCAPFGIGVLYAKKELLEAMPPFLGGGDMIKKVKLERSEWNDLPWKFEAGTSPVAEAIGLGFALDYLNKVGIQLIREHEIKLTKYAQNKLQEIPGISIFGPRDEQLKNGILAFTLQDLHPHDVASILDEQGIAVRAGHHCAMPLHQHLGVPATLRVSFYLYNDKHDVDKLVAGVKKALKILKSS